MWSFCLEDTVWSYCPPFRSHRLLPNDSIVFTKMAGTRYEDLEKYFQQIPEIKAKYVFVDESPDPINLSNEEIKSLLERYKNKFPDSRCIFLSSRCADYYANDPDIFWYPWWITVGMENENYSDRKKRIGCLNRRPDFHRVYLMYNLLEEKLLDHDRDIFSVDFGSKNWKTAYPGKFDNLDRYPNKIATIQDNFPNDMTNDHPAWKTAITVVSETKVDGVSIITEKTTKAMATECCWITQCGPHSLQILEDLGFNTNTFPTHAVENDIQPILDVCKSLDTESSALDYYHSKIDVIKHNKEWYINNKWEQPYLDRLNKIL